MSKKKSLEQADKPALPLKTNGLKMTAMEEAMCREYVANNFRQDAAALKAGYSKKYAAKKAFQIVERCQPFIAELIKNTQRRIGVSPKAVKGELWLIASANLDDFKEEDPKNPGRFRYKSPGSLTRDQMACVKSFTCEKGPSDDWEYKYVFHEKRPALMDMARVLGMVDSKMNMMLMQADKVTVNNYDLSRLPTKDLEEIEKMMLSKYDKLPDDAEPHKGRTIDGETE